MNPLKNIILSIGVLFLATSAFADPQSGIPPVIERYEQILLKSPEKGTAFDKVYQYYFENEGLEKLADRWRAAAKSADSNTAIANSDLMLGLLLDRQGKAAEARIAFAEATKQNPADYRAWRVLGDLEAGEGRMPDAIAAFGKALASNPPAAERSPLYRQLARSQQRNLDAAGALATWQKMAEEFPSDPFVIEEVAEAQLEAEKFDEARKTFTRLRDLAGTDPFKKVTANIRLAQVEERQGKIKEALAIYESTLPEASETSWIHRDVRARIEEVYRRQDDLPGLVGYYEKWLGGHDKDVEAATRLSAALVELNRKKEAVAWLQKAVAWAPDRREIQIDLAKMLNETDQAVEAQKILAALTQSFPEELSYWEMLGDTEWLLFKKSNEPAHKKAAIDAWQKLAQKGIQDANRVSRLGDILREKGLNDEALVEFERAVSLAPEASDLRERWAGFLFELRRDEEAWKIIAGLVAGDRAVAANFQRLATIQTKYGKLDDALDSIKKGVALAPGDYSLLALEWRILSERKEWEAAAALYEPMLAAAPAMYEQIEQQYLQALRAANKLEAVQKDLLGKLPAADEVGVRLLARMALQSDDLVTARTALDEGKKRFPESFSLALLESNLSKRNGDLDARVAVLRRLIALEPKQTSDFLQEIARAYQDQQKWDQALGVAQEWIAASPVSTDARIFCADLNFAAGRSAEGIENLREGIKLSDKPNQIRLRLAQAYGQAGDLARAQQTAEEAFEAEEDASVKIGILRQLSEFYFQQGRIDVLIARFRERQRSEEGGWRYALYLSEIFQQMQDFGQAREELAKSLASRPKDPALLKQLVRLAQQEGNTAEEARYDKTLAEVEPSPANTAALAEALADNGDTAGAIQILTAHEADLLNNPAPWRMAFAKVQKEGAAVSLNASLESALRQRPDDFNGRMTLAEMQIALNNLELAKRALWDIRRMPKPAQAVPAPTPVPSSSPPARFNPFGGGSSSVPERRISASSNCQQSFSQLVDSQQAGRRSYGRSRYYYNGYISGAQAGASSAPTFENIRDKALVYLAAIALRETKVDAFLADLEKELADQNADRMERFVCYSLVVARDQLWREIQAQADSPGGELDQLCLEQIPQLMGQPNQPAPEAARAAVLLEKLGNRLAKADPKGAFFSAAMRYQVLNMYGQKDEANQILPGLLDKLDESDPMQLQYAVSIATEMGDMEKAQRYLQKMVADAKSKKLPLGNLTWLKFSLAQTCMKNKDVKNGARFYAEAFIDSLPAQRGGSSSGPRMFSSGYRGVPQMPYTNRYIDDQRLNFLRQAYQALKPQNGLDAYIEAISQAEVPKGNEIYPQLAIVYMKWLDGKKEAALQEAQAVLSANPDDELRLLVAGMEGDLNQAPAAVALLDQVTVRQGDVYKRAQQALLKIAKQAKDPDSARKAALRLVSLRLQPQEIRQLLPDLKELGLTEKVEQIQKKMVGAGNRPNEINERVQLLQTYRNEKKSDEGIALAKSLLALDPFGNQQNGDYYRSNALSALEGFKALDAYIADLEKQAGAAPDSARICMLLAEAQAKKDPKKAPEYYRKVLALKPADTGLELKLIQALQRQNQKEDALKMTQELLAKEPTLIFDGRTDFVGLFRNMKKLPELAELVLKQSPRPASATSSGNDQSAWVCNRLGEDLRDGCKDLNLAVKVWLKAIELQDANNSSQRIDLRKNVIDGLVELGRKDEAIQQLEENYFPPPPKQALLGTNYGYNNSSWMNSTSTSGMGEVSFPGLAPLRVAEKLGCLDALRKKAEGKADADDAMKCLALIIRARQHDPKLLEDLPKLLAQSVYHQGMSVGFANTAFLCVLSGELSDWPQAVSLSLDLLASAKKLCDNNPGNYRENGAICSKIFHRAMEAGKTEVACAAAKEFVEVVVNSGSNSNFNETDTVSIISQMLGLGLVSECEKLIAFLKTSRQSRGNSLSEAFARAESDIALSKGEVPNPQAIACSAGEENGKSVILWEIRSASANSPSRSPQAGFSGIDFPKLDGRWDLELQALSGVNAVRRLAMISKVKSRGKWVGKLPEGTFRIQAVLHSPSNKKEVDSLSYSGQWIPVTNVPNLLVNPGFDGVANAANPAADHASSGPIKGWEHLPDASLKPGGPRPGGLSAVLKFDGNRQNPPLLGERIPVEKGKEYLQTGWLKLWSGDDANYGVRFLDQDGKEVGSETCGHHSGYLAGWTFLSQTLSAAGRKGEHDIPEKAAFLQPFLEARGTISLQYLFLGDVTLPKTESKPDALPAP